ncbi:MAG TPA: metal ABC transporter substrate-binding protein [Candidatus Luteococcus avicola]|nr:metal ABC transporter substrate-binding protein [Candidatus Luteococcus avicola]
MIAMKFCRRLAPIALACTLLATASACGGAQNSSGAQDASGSGLEVVASFYPLAFLTEQIAGDHASVSSLTTPGQEPHDLELSAKQVASVGQADLFVYQSDFQGAVDDAVETTSPQQVVDATGLVTLLTTTEEEHDHEGEVEGEDHDHGSTDPHIWLAPKNMVKIADGIEAKLAEVDPGHASDYANNLARLTASLGRLDADFSTGLATCERTEFITSHAAFGYLAHAYGLTQIGISGLSPDEEPSPTRIAEVQKLATEHGVTTIFYETLVSPDIATSIAGDLKLRTAVLDPVEGITPDSPGTNYFEVMNANLTALKTANGCQ